MEEITGKILIALRDTRPANPKPYARQFIDIVSKVEIPEVVNAIQQAMKEVIQRLRPEGFQEEHHRSEREGTHDHPVFLRRLPD
ncbi:MAG: DUF520 family protein [Paludibaculum sp.]